MIYRLYFILIFSISCTNTSNHYDSTSTKTANDRLKLFFQHKFDEILNLFPMKQTYLGRKTNYDKLNNGSQVFREALHKKYQKTLDELYTKFDYKNLDEQMKLSYDIFEYDLKIKIESFKWRYHDYQLNQKFGFHTSIPSSIIANHSIKAKKDALDYISRLKDIKRYFKEKLIDQKIREKKGLFPPNFVFSQVIENAKNIIRGRPFDETENDSPFLGDFKKKLGKLKISTREKEKIVSMAKNALLDYVMPAYNDLIEYFNTLEKKATRDHGVWSLPDGLDYYSFLIKKYTTTELSADNIHKRGLEEVERIHREMKMIMKKIKFIGGLNKFFLYMKDNRDFIYPDTKEGHKNYLSKTNHILSNIRVKLPQMFELIPKTKLVIKPVEKYREKNAGIVYYRSPSVNGDRPGTFYVNLYKMRDNQKYRMETRVYHEALPGHHLQFSMRQILKDLPAFRKSIKFTSYTEGWALYAEKLPKEFGFYKDPYSDFGRLAMELWRACRLVVDTGIHSKKWTKEKAIKYLNSNTPRGMNSIIKEVERYFVRPGQALSYKIGMNKILQLRQVAKNELGHDFDLRKFHHTVLKDGALPLFLLEKRVMQWIKKEKTHIN